MSEFKQQLSELKKRMPRIPAWVVVAVVAAIALLGYYSYQGMRYWEANQEFEALGQEIDRVSLVLSRTPPETGDLTADLQQREGSLAELQQLFTYSTTDEIMGTISETAEESGVGLASMSLGDAIRERQGDMRFLQQPFSLTLQGDTDDVYTFLSDLHDRIPVAQVSDIRLNTSPNEGSVATVQMVFHLSPQLPPEEDGEEDGAD